METAFQYATNQLFGLQFEPFRYTALSGVLFNWQANALTRALCRWLFGLGWVSAARFVFTRSVEVV